MTVFHLFGSGFELQFDVWNKEKKAAFKATEYSTLIMGVKKTCLKTSRLLRKSGMVWIGEDKPRGQAAFSILTAQTLNSGILETGSRAPFVSLFTAAS